MRGRMRSFLMLLFHSLPTPKSVWGFMGYLVVVLYPLSLVLAALSNVDLIAKYIDWIKWALNQWWGYPLCVLLGFFLLLYAGYRQQSTPHQAKEVSGEKQVPTTESEELRIARERLERAVYQAKQENDSLRRQVRELEMMSPEEYRARQEERRKRIAKWRTEIENGNFQRAPLDGSLFTATNTYQDMKPWLLDHARDRLENPLRTQVLFDLARKKPIPNDKDVLLGEVSRIEKEWGLI